MLHREENYERSRSFEYLVQSLFKPPSNTPTLEEGRASRVRQAVEQAISPSERSRLGVA